MHGLPSPPQQCRRDGRRQRLAFAGHHLHDLAVEHTQGAHQLDEIGLLPHFTLRGLSDHREGLADLMWKLEGDFFERGLGMSYIRFSIRHRNLLSF